MSYSQHQTWHISTKKILIGLQEIWKNPSYFPHKFLHIFRIFLHISSYIVIFPPYFTASKNSRMWRHQREGVYPRILKLPPRSRAENFSKSPRHFSECDVIRGGSGPYRRGRLGIFPSPQAYIVGGIPSYFSYFFIFSTYFLRFFSSPIRVILRTSQNIGRGWWYGCGENLSYEQRWAGHINS